MRAKNAGSVHTHSRIAGENRFRRLLILALVALMSAGLIACADDDPSSEACEGEECENNENENGENGELKQCLAVVSTVWGSEGSLSILDVESRTIETNITTLFHDVGLAHDGDLLYAINRMGSDNVQAISIEDEYATVWQYSVGENANPQTLVVSGDYGFLPSLSGGKVLIVDLTADKEEDFLLENSIEIAPIAEWDGGVAELGNVLVHNGVLYVVSQGLGDDWECAEEAHSQLLAFDVETFEPAPVFDDEATLNLETCNASALHVVDNTLYVQSLGAYRSMSETPTDDGGIEAIALETGISLGMVLTETEANESDILQAYAAKDGNGLWLVLGGADFFTQALHYFDVSGDSMELIASPVLEGYVGHISESEDYLFITSRSDDDEGLAILDAETFEMVTEELIDTGLPPDATLLFEREGSCF